MVKIDEDTFSNQPGTDTIQKLRDTYLLLTSSDEDTETTAETFNEKVKRLNAMKQSELLRLAIQDLRNLRKNGTNYVGKKIPVKTDGRTWIEIEENRSGEEYCTVCLAGAVFLGTLGQQENACIHDFGFTLNNLRVGHYDDENGRPRYHNPTEQAATEAGTLVAPLRTYERFANFLEKRGL